MTPREFAVERQVDAPPEVVWALLTDADGYGAWNRAILEIAGPIARGATVRLVSIASPGRTFAVKVTAFEAPSRMVWESGMPLGLFRGVRTFDLARTPSGGTDFRMRERYSGPLAPLVGRAIPDLSPSFAVFADGLAGAAAARG